METTPLDGYKKIIITILTLAAGSLGLFITDPAKAQTIGQFLIDVLGPVLVVLVGIIYTIVQGNIDKEKVKADAYKAKAQIQATSPKAESVAVLQPIAAPVVEAEETYKPVDLAACVARAEEAVKKDGLMISPLNRAFYFWPYVTGFDLRDVPRQLRVSEAKSLIDKAVELFSDAFKFQTKLPKPPTPVEAANYHTYLFKLKKDYEKANNLLCSNKTFEELRNLVGYFNDLYTAQDGITQLSGKTVDWSIYGGGAFTPTQVGWDYVKLL